MKNGLKLGGSEIGVDDQFGKGRVNKPSDDLKPAMSLDNPYGRRVNLDKAEQDLLIGKIRHLEAKLAALLIEFFTGEVDRLRVPSDMALTRDRMARELGAEFASYKLDVKIAKMNHLVTIIEMAKAGELAVKSGAIGTEILNEEGVERYVEKRNRKIHLPEVLRMICKSEESLLKFQESVDGEDIKAIKREIGMTSRALEKEKSVFLRFNMGLVDLCLKKYSNTRLEGNGVGRDDLFGEGVQALLYALDRFDSTIAGFSTFAIIWIRQKLRRVFDNQGSTIRIPVYTRDLLRNIYGWTSEFVITYRREPTVEEIALAFEMSVEEINRLSQISRPTISLDAPRGAYEDGSSMLTLKDTIPDDTSEHWHEFASSEAVAQAMATLPERTATVIRRVVCDGMFLKDVGKDLGVSNERVRQIREKGLEQLRAYFDEDSL